MVHFSSPLLVETCTLNSTRFHHHWILTRLFALPPQSLSTCPSFFSHLGLDYFCRQRVHLVLSISVSTLRFFLAKSASCVFYLYFYFEVSFLESNLLKPHPDKTRCDLFFCCPQPFKHLLKLFYSALCYHFFLFWFEWKLLRCRESYS